MNMIRLIAWREYMKNIKTKGFWVGILLFPAIFTTMYFLQTTLSNSTPIRHYIFIDQTGEYSEAVETAIEREHQRRILGEFVSYLMDNRKEIDLNLAAAGGANAAEQLIVSADADEVAALEQWLENGGLDFALTMASPALKEDKPPFEQPSRQFIAADLPEGIDSSATPEELAQALRPYLSGEKKIIVDSQPGDLFALILIPANVNDDISRPGVMPQSVDSLWEFNIGQEI
tara:strand:- start:2204 stop:2896 length:693 start_codon:yes stop_codon:yes gene_type:complete